MKHNDYQGEPVEIGNGYRLLYKSPHHCHLAIKDLDVYIFDNSGSNPDRTDDGPLIVSVEDLLNAGAIQVSACYKAFGPSAGIPVNHPAGRESPSPYRSYIDLEGAILLGRFLAIDVQLVTPIYKAK